jgi:hypothetical protein
MQVKEMKQGFKNPKQTLVTLARINKNEFLASGLLFAFMSIAFCSYSWLNGYPRIILCTIFTGLALGWGSYMIYFYVVKPAQQEQLETDARNRELLEKDTAAANRRDAISSQLRYLKQKGLQSPGENYGAISFVCFLNEDTFTKISFTAFYEHVMNLELRGEHRLMPRSVVIIDEFNAVSIGARFWLCLTGLESSSKGFPSLNDLSGRVLQIHASDYPTWEDLVKQILLFTSEYNSVREYAQQTRMNKVANMLGATKRGDRSNAKMQEMREILDNPGNKTIPV